MGRLFSCLEMVKVLILFFVLCFLRIQMQLVLLICVLLRVPPYYFLLCMQLYAFKGLVVEIYTCKILRIVTTPFLLLLLIYYITYHFVLVLNSSYKFQDEMQASLMQNIIMVAIDVSMKIYQVSRCGDKDSIRQVTYSNGKDCARCTCLMFEFTGIPCRHILTVLRYHDHNILPAPYIMRRWTKFVKRQIVVDKVSDMLEVGSNINLSSHLSELSYWANKLVDVGLVSKETLNLVKKRFWEAYEETKSLSSKDGESVNEQSNEKDKELSLVEVYEPDHAKTKGRNKRKRMKPGMENVKGRNRMCNGCKQRGQNHDI